MSYEEKGTWVYLVVSLGTYAAYAAVILGRAQDVPLTEVPHIAAMLWAIGIAIVLAIVGSIVIAITKPSEADKKDARDKDINRFGEYVGGIVLGVCMVAPLILSMAKSDHFWITNAIYAAFVVSAAVSASVKLVAYRRGL